MDTPRGNSSPIVNQVAVRYTSRVALQQKLERIFPNTKEFDIKVGLPTTSIAASRLAIKVSQSVKCTAYFAEPA